MLGFLSLACLVIVACFTITSSSLTTPSNNPPKISVSQSENNNGSQQFSMLNETLVIISKYTTQNIVLSCSASYPVMWSLSSLDNLMVVDGSIQAERKVGNFRDTSTYEYSMRVSINNQLPVNSTSQPPETFICLRADLNATNRDLLLSTASSRLVVIWESSVWPYWNDIRSQLLIDGEYQIYWKEEATNQQLVNWILIPCYSLNANETKVELFKRANYKDGDDDLEGEVQLVLQVVDEVEEGESGTNVLLRFEPYVGFYVYELSIHGDIEVYECHAQGQEGLSVFQGSNSSGTTGTNNSSGLVTRIFKLTKLNNTAGAHSTDLARRAGELGGTRARGIEHSGAEVDPFAGYLSWPNPYLRISLSSHRVQCCTSQTGSNGEWSSENFMLYYQPCTQPLMCLTKNYRRKSLSHSRRHDSMFDNNCRNMPSPYGIIRHSSAASPNLFGCHLRTDKKLTGMDYLLFAYSDYYEIDEANSETSFVFQESNPEESSFMQFAPSGTLNDGYFRLANGLQDIQFYLDETVHVRCQSSPFFYADGILWEKEWENSTNSFVREQVNATQQHSTPPLLSSFDLHLKIEAGLKAIKCYIPLWNTTTWISHSLSFSTNPSSNPASPTGQTMIHENVTFYTGENKTLDCNFDGIPTPKFVWRILNSGSECNPNGMGACYSLEDDIRGRHTVRSPYATSTNSTTLHYEINKSSTKTTAILSPGQASCEARNSVGTATKYFYLQALESKRPIMKEPARESIAFFLDDEDSFLTCSVIHGMPQPAFSWKKHETSIEHFTNYYTPAESPSSTSRSNFSTLTFKKVRYEDDGDYICVASNFLGNATYIFSVRVRERHPGTYAEIAIVFLSVALVIMVGLFVYMTASRAKINSTQVQQGAVEYSSRGRDGGEAENLQSSQVTLGTNLG